MKDAAILKEETAITEEYFNEFRDKVSAKKTHGSWKLVTKTSFDYAWFKYGVVATPKDSHTFTGKEIQAVQETIGTSFTQSGADYYFDYESVLSVD